MITRLKAELLQWLHGLSILRRLMVQSVRKWIYTPFKVKNASLATLTLNLILALALTLTHLTFGQGLPVDSHLDGELWCRREQFEVPCNTALLTRSPFSPGSVLTPIKLSLYRRFSNTLYLACHLPQSNFTSHSFCRSQQSNHPHFHQQRWIGIIKYLLPLLRFVVHPDRTVYLIHIAPKLWF